MKEALVILAVVALLMAVLVAAQAQTNKTYTPIPLIHKAKCIAVVQRCDQCPGPNGTTLQCNCRMECLPFPD